MLLTLVLLAQTASARPAATVRTAVDRALPALEQSARTFAANRSCVSCHHNILPILTLRLAASRGFRIDTATLEAVERKTFRELTNTRAFDDAVQGAGVSDPTPNDSWLLVAAHEAGLALDLTNAVYAKRIASWQHDGHWTTSDFRPPHSSSAFTATATAVRAFDAYFPPQLTEVRAAVLGDARRWLVATRPASTEDATFRLLGLVWAKAPASDLAAASRDLLTLQKPGGGWAQLAGYPQDAYSTGEALFALHEAGVPASDASWRKGLAFLGATQSRDGTWRVRTRMLSPADVSPEYFSTGFPYKKDEYISYAASCWATLALLSALPAQAATPEPTAVARDEKADVAPWMRTALFGTTAELAALLDGGLSSNVATPNGTSILMMAAQDDSKVKLLLARGADARRRAVSGYDAITAAASYRGSSASVRALLDAGADVEPPENARVKHSALLFASMSGDLETVSLLLSRGASANPSSGDSPLSEAITFGHADVVHALIAAGATTSLVERTGVNLLHWATITNRAAVIPELAKAGVPIDAMDDAGFTPLMYAATIDFGDTETLKALLRAGADRRLRNDEGRTALQQARHYKHTRLEAALQ